MALLGNKKQEGKAESSSTRRTTPTQGYTFTGENRTGAFNPKQNYNPFERDAGNSTNPTVDAAVQAFDERKLATQQKAEATVAEKQAQFQAELNNREKGQKDAVEQSKIFQSEQMRAQQGFRAKEGLDENGQETKEKVQTGLSNAWFGIALLLAAIFDTASFFINGIPVIGGFIASGLITPVALGVMWFIHKINGVEFTSKVRSRFIISAVIEFIPLLNALPGIVLLVVLSKGIPIAGTLAEKMGGPVGGAIAKAIDPKDK